MHLHVAAPMQALFTFCWMFFKAAYSTHTRAGALGGTPAREYTARANGLAPTDDSRMCVHGQGHGWGRICACQKHAGCGRGAGGYAAAGYSGAASAGPWYYIIRRARVR